MAKIPPIASFKVRLQAIDKEMEDPDFFADRKRSVELSREHQKLSELVKQYERMEKAALELAENRQMLSDGLDDEEMREMVESDIESLEQEIDQLEKDVLVGMLPPDPADSRNTIFEIRAGAGGDEASIFVADLYRMYTRFAEMRSWKIEVMNTSLSDHGFKEVSFLISGEDVYRTLKYESGVHRVQRVPDTEASGRIHTSTVTVAVLPEAEEVDIEINPSDLEIKVCRASGPGGQGVNTTDSAVQIFHKPSGTMVTCADERSQLKNKAKALAVLRARLLKAKEEEEHSKYAANRRAQVGTGDRSERIRTYNFPQGRISDHRINLTLYNLPEVMEGSLDDVVTALEEESNRLKVEQLLEKTLG